MELSALRELIIKLSEVQISIARLFQSTQWVAGKQCH